MTKGSKLLFALMVVWGLFIFANSLMPGEASTQMSDAVVDSLPGWASAWDVHSLTVLVRKSAHFLEYALLGALCAWGFAASGKLWPRNTGNVLFPCLAWAVADEFLQTFIEGRTGLVRDVVIDFGGILTGCLIVLAVSRLRRRRRRRRY